MNKKMISFFAITGSILGACLPSFFGDNDIFSGWSILCGFAGGIFGVWLGVQIAKRY